MGFGPRLKRTIATARFGNQGGALGPSIAGMAVSFLHMIGGSGFPNVTEANVQNQLAVSGTIRRWAARANTGALSTGTLVLRLRINGANVGTAMTFAAGSPGMATQIIVEDIAIAEGDLVCVSVTNNDAAIAATFNGLHVEIDFN